MKDYIKYTEINMKNNEFTLPPGYDWSTILPIRPLDSYFVHHEIVRNMRQMYGYNRAVFIAFEGISAN